MGGHRALVGGGNLGGHRVLVECGFGNLGVKVLVGCGSLRGHRVLVGGGNLEGHFLG